MKVLLLHPEDSLQPRQSACDWDLVVDFARAPASSYQVWSRQVGCSVISLFDFAERIDDLHRCRELLQPGMGRLIDRRGVDWWDVISLEMVPDLLQLMLVGRLAKYLGTPCQLYASRSFPLAAALGNRLGVQLEHASGGAGLIQRRARHYLDAFSRLNAGQLAQVIQDKGDPGHRVRRWLSRSKPGLRRPVTLLPTAYLNVSRTAVSYAALLPGQDFLLVYARKSGYLESLPANVQVASLDSYFRPVEKGAFASLLAGAVTLKRELAASGAEFRAADSVGFLDRIPDRLRSALNIATAWTNVLESEQITACFCADDTNPYTRIPLILAKQKSMPALTCHHGALDSWMALKTQHADFHLAKSEMERDYLQTVCRVAPERIVVAGGAPPKPIPPVRRSTQAPWLVFFTEPYQSAHWRTDEVYRELLPGLWDLAQTCGLNLVFKLHPFESIKGHRLILRRHLPARESQIGIIAGPPPAEFWEKIRFAMTVQSSTALECAALGIPVFLCGWLRDSYSGYVGQYARFGVGQVLESPAEFSAIPRLLEAYCETDSCRSMSGGTIDREQLAGMFAGAGHLQVASHA